MAKIKVTGMEKYADALEKLGNEAEGVCKMAVYDGAAAVVKSVESAIKNLPERDAHEYGTEKHRVSGVTAAEKQGLLDGLGIARMRSDEGAVNARIGFDGYNANGKANSMIARSQEAGTSWLSPHPFISPAAGTARGKAQRAMKETLEEEIKKRME